jgi:hypothetical protein
MWFWPDRGSRKRSIRMLKVARAARMASMESDLPWYLPSRWFGAGASVTWKPASVACCLSFTPYDPVPFMESRTFSAEAPVWRRIQDTARFPPVVVAGNVSLATSPPLAVLMMANVWVLAWYKCRRRSRSALPRSSFPPGCRE